MDSDTRQVVLTLEDVGERLDRALTAAVPELSRMQWQLSLIHISEPTRPY